MFDFDIIALIAVSLLDDQTTTENFLDGSDQDDVESINVIFKIDADSALLDSSYPDVAVAITNFLSSTLNVSDDRIRNLKLSAGK